MQVGGGEMLDGGRVDSARACKAPPGGKAMDAGRIFGATVLKIPQRAGIVR